MTEFHTVKIGDCTLILGDCVDVLQTLPEESVQCVVTSPPYWGLRDYGVDGQIGLEPDPREYIEKMVEVFRGVRRVLRDDGVCWVNMGDCYATGAGKVGDCPGGGAQGARWAGKHIGRLMQNGIGRRGAAVGPAIQPNRLPLAGFKPKDLIGMPWRLAFALQADGWWLRSDCIWSKPNPMPESVTDRPTKAHEYVFLLTKRGRYFYDAEAVKEADSGQDHRRGVLAGQASLEPSGGLRPVHSGIRTAEGRNGNGRNLRTVWTIPSAPFPGAHFATFPPELAEICIMAGTSERGCCPDCGAPWERVAERTKFEKLAPNTKYAKNMAANRLSGSRDAYRAFGLEGPPPARTIGFRPTCTCPPQTPIPCTVLDPFGGAGTVGLVAERLQRRSVLIELNGDYVAMAEQRIRDDATLLTARAALPEPKQPKQETML